jgi:hypothetical protein
VNQFRWLLRLSINTGVPRSGTRPNRLIAASLDEEGFSEWAACNNPYLNGAVR